MNNSDFMKRLLDGVEVEWKSLSEIGIISGAGVDKKKVLGEKSIKLLNYMDIYRNKYLRKEIPSMIVTATDKKIEQCNILKGDLFFTPSSEVLNDIGKSSVALEDMEGIVYSYHIMRLRLNKTNLITSMFINYLFDSQIIQNQINKSAKGITRFGLTKTQWEKINIPIPPLKVQEEIVRILDKFTELTVELKTELTARKKQYEYYENQLIYNNSFKKESLSKHCTVNQGLQLPISDRKLENGKNRYFYITVQFLKNGSDKYYIENPSENVICDYDDILVTRTGSTGKIITGVKGCFHNNFFKVNCFDSVNKRYMYYVLKSKKMYEKMLNVASGGTVPDLPHKNFYNLEFPVPPLEEQERIVSILDKFDTLTTSIAEGLPREIELRKKQYEYYRDLLLNFPRKEND